MPLLSLLALLVNHQKMGLNNQNRLLLICYGVDVVVMITLLSACLSSVWAQLGCAPGSSRAAATDCCSTRRPHQEGTDGSSRVPLCHGQT